MSQDSLACVTQVRLGRLLCCEWDSSFIHICSSCFKHHLLKFEGKVLGSMRPVLSHRFCCSLLLLYFYIYFASPVNGDICQSPPQIDIFS